MTDYAQWYKGSNRYDCRMIGHCNYRGYPGDVQFRKAKNDAMKDNADYLEFNGQLYERHKSRWYFCRR